MRTEGLPESTNVEDRRGEKPATTLAEMAKLKRLPTDMSPPDPTSQLAKDLGVDDIGRLANPRKES